VTEHTRTGCVAAWHKCRGLRAVGRRHSPQGTFPNARPGRDDFSHGVSSSRASHALGVVASPREDQLRRRHGCSVCLVEGGKSAKQVVCADADLWKPIVIDLDLEGHVVGFEFLEASEMLPAGLLDEFR
jgi:uncharacterized protein YuzE